MSSENKCRSHLPSSKAKGVGCDKEREGANLQSREIGFALHLHILKSSVKWGMWLFVEQERYLHMQL